MLGYLLLRLKIKNFLFLLTLPALFYTIQIIYLNFYNPDSHLPIILWWTPFMAVDEQVISCPKHKCLLTKNKEYANYTNLKALLFYGTQFDTSNLPLPKSKIWGVLHEESPRNVALFLYNRTFELFDIRSTFSRFSDFPLTLQYLENLSLITDTHYAISLEEKNKLLNDIAPVLYIQSDCDTPVQREVYVKKLMKYIKIDSYGPCLNNKKFPDEIAKLYSLDLYNEKLLHFIAKYKFIIAFENAICEDYITEKLWRPLIVGSVPIYLGSPSIEDWLPNTNSAILAKNFPTPKSLAHYINRINEDDKMYEKFLEHKFGKIENDLLKSALNKGPFGVETDLENPISAFECFVCDQIHEGGRNKYVKSVYDCAEPVHGSGWEHHWNLGDCQSKVLVDLVRSNGKSDLRCD